MERNLTEKGASIVSSALQQGELFGIVDVLKEIAQAVEACGCILWETDPWADLKSDSPEGNLYVFASWFDGFDLPLQEIPLSDKSVNKIAIKTQETVLVENMQTDPRIYKHDFSMIVAKFTSMCIVPISFDADGKINASLSVYRRLVVNEFKLAEQRFIEQVAKLIPSLFQAIRYKVRHHKLKAVIDILEDAKQKAKADNDNIEEINKGFKKVCEEVAETFGCIETSLFLENKLEKENLFNLVATSYSDWTSEKKVYSAERDKDHLTGWVLGNMEPVSIFDLGNFIRDREKLRKKYKDINWKDSLNIKQAAKRILILPEGSTLPPLSFMAAPIIKDNRILGVIRCCTAKKAPWFFADRQLRILDLISNQIASFWSDWIQHLEETRESETWKKFIEEISKLNAKVQQRIDKSDIDEEKLYEQILDLAKNSIKNSDILDIRLYDDKNEELYFAKTKGFEKPKAKGQEIENRKKKTFPIDKSFYEEVPLGILVFGDGVARCIMNAEQENYRSKTFPETKRILVAPIGIQKDTIGVLDIRNISDKPFPPHALRMATLLGQQLGLYLSLWESEKQQRQVFEDLFHQAKSPVRQIYARANDLLQSIDFEQWHSSDEERIDTIKIKTLMLRGVARKARRVIFNAGVFKDLSRDEKLKLDENKLKRLYFSETVKMLFEAYKDTEQLLESSWRIKFFVDKTGFIRLDKIQVRASQDFLEQAINCLLDNAGKYSFSDTTVRITGGEITKGEKNYFYFAVSNEGFEVKSEEIPKLKRRYYRGAAAKATTGEGSGIGLWVVDHIMKAHNGELEIIPTNLYGRNEVRLLFPIEK
jgi:signal transduction histidine kinase